MIEILQQTFPEFLEPENN